MRALTAVAALLFAYLALIPGGLVVSVWDSACSGEGCESSLLTRVAFTLLYGACLLAVAVTALAFGRHALRGTPAGLERLPRVLAGCALVIGGATFVLFTVAYPLGGAIAAGLAAASYAGLRIAGGSGEPPARPGRGLRGVNGHRPG